MIANTKAFLAILATVILAISLGTPILGQVGVEDSLMDVDDEIQGHWVRSFDEEAYGLEHQTSLELFADEYDEDEDGYPTAGHPEGEILLGDSEVDVDIFSESATRDDIGWTIDDEVVTPSQGENIYFLSETLEDQTEDSGYLWAARRIPESPSVAEDSGDLVPQYEQIAEPVETDTGSDFIEITVESPAYTDYSLLEDGPVHGTYELFENYAVFMTESGEENWEYQGVTEEVEGEYDDPIVPDFEDPQHTNPDDVTTGENTFTAEDLEAEEYEFKVRPQFDFGDHFTGHYDEEEMDDYYTTQRAGPSVTVETDDDEVEVDEIVVEEDVTATAGVEGEITVTAYDEDEEPVEGEEISIDDDDDLGGIEEGETEVTDEEGEVSFTFEEEAAGDYEVLFSAEDEDITDSGTVTIEPADTVEVSIDPDEDQTVATGETIEFEATAYDEFDNVVEDVDTEFTWENTDDDGTFEEEETGDYEVTATYDDVTSPVTTVTVEDTEVAYVLLYPEDDFTTEAGEEELFDAEAYDENDELITNESEDFDWQNAEADVENGVFYEEEAGDYDVVATYDGVSSDPTTVTVEPADPDYIIVEPDGAELEAGATQAYTATSYDEFHNEIGDVTGETDWTDDIDDSEWTDNELTAYTAGEWTVTGEYEALEDTVDLEVEPAAVDTVEIDPEEDQVVEADEELLFDVEIRDEYGNLITDDPTHDDIDWQNAPRGLFRKQNAGEYDVTATYEGEESDVTVVTVEPAEVDYVVIDPDEDQTVEAGEELQFTAEAYDEWGNLIEDDPEEFEWENADDTGLFEETEVGDYDVTATYEDNEEESATSPATTVTVEPADPDYIEIEPDEYTVIAGEDVDYTATAYDEFDNEIGDVTEETDWWIEEDAGGEWDQENGVYTSENAGEWTVEGTYTFDGEDLVDDALLEVEESDAAYIEIEPEDSTITAGDTEDYTATAYDEEDNEIGDVTEETDWSIDEDAGGEWDQENGVYTSEFAGEWTVVGDYQGLEDTADLEVEPGPVDTVNIYPGEDVTIITGEKQVFEAEALDEFGNLITDSVTDFDWAESTRGVFYQTTPGDYDVTATYETVTSEATTVTVEPDEAAYLVIEPEDSTIVAGDTETYTATAYDENGYEIGDVTADTDWSIEAGAGGTWTDNVYEGEFAGEWTVTAQYGDAIGEAELTVEPSEVVDVQIGTDDDTTIVSGEKVVFWAEAYDEYGNLVSSSAVDFTWQNAVRGVFDEPEPGDYDVTATLDGVTSNVITVTVEEG